MLLRENNNNYNNNTGYQLKMEFISFYKRKLMIKNTLLSIHVLFFIIFFKNILFLFLINYIIIKI